ncbi:hypothetical protein C8R46DRAFT_289384 [Mycena filopes]|nr:hypothetical protein C8R46DRAFT_289384 [Mycena filopes]
MSTYSVFHFPPELEREIFETAALQETNIIPTILRVCRRVHVWIEPLLYRVVVLPTRAISVFAAVKSKSPTFLQMAVRHLFIAPEMEDASKVLLSCSGVYSLFLDGRLPANLLDVLDSMRVRRLNFTLPISPLSGWADATLTRRAFLSLTHLELYQDSVDPSTDFSWPQWSPLASLPALTHLCLSESLSSHILPDLVAEGARLVVVVTAWWDGTASEEEAREFAEGLAVRRVTDPRVVVMTIDSYTEEWKLGAHGGDDFWVRAESFLAMKRKGEIPKNVFFFLDD